MSDFRKQATRAVDEVLQYSVNAHDRPDVVESVVDAILPLHEAELERLREENERLRKALERIARGPYGPPDEPWSKAEALIALRAALSNEGER